MAPEIFVWEDEEMKTEEAPFWIAASATPKPIPDEPPMTRTRDPASLETYFPSEAILMCMFERMRCKMRVRGECEEEKRCSLSNVDTAFMLGWYGRSKHGLHGLS